MPRERNQSLFLLSYRYAPYRLNAIFSCSLEDSALISLSCRGTPYDTNNPKEEKASIEPQRQHDLAAKQAQESTSNSPFPRGCHHHHELFISSAGRRVRDIISSSKQSPEFCVKEHVHKVQRSDITASFRRCRGQKWKIGTIGISWS
jgi:hypothetical protein